MSRSTMERLVDRVVTHKDGIIKIQAPDSRNAERYASAALPGDPGLEVRLRAIFMAFAEHIVDEVVRVNNDTPAVHYGDSPGVVVHVDPDVPLVPVEVAEG